MKGNVAFAEKFGKFLSGRVTLTRQYAYYLILNFSHSCFNTFLTSYKVKKAYRVMDGSREEVGSRDSMHKQNKTFGRNVVLSEFTTVFAHTTAGQARNDKIELWGTTHQFKISFFCLRTKALQRQT